MHKYIHILREFDQLIDNTMSNVVRNNITDHSKNSTHISL